MLKPFEENEYLHGSCVEALQKWLCENVDPTIKLTADYAIKDLINDLGRIEDGMWSDGISAMGEDA